MRTPNQSTQRAEHGYALMLTMFLVAVMLVALGSVIAWTSAEAGLTSRNNLYHTTVAGAEAGTERVLAEIDRDFVYQSVKSGNLNYYRVLLPEQTDWPVQFAYSDGAGTDDQTGLISLGPTVVANLNSEFQGLYGLVSPYRVTSRAAPLNQNHDLSATVVQEFELARIPIFQYAIFYSIDLEINPGADMVVRGKTHSNGEIYAAPSARLEFKDVVTSVGAIENYRHPDDPTTGGKTMPTYVNKLENVSALVLPIGTNNSPAAVQAILDPPPSGEDPNSSLGRQRIYNQSDLIISNTSSGVVITSGAWNEFKAVPPDAGSSYSFVTNVSFYDYREGKTVKATEIDVGKFNTWLAATTTNGGSTLNATARTKMSHGLNSVYTIDSRPVTTTSVAGVRVANGAQLPADGFTVATAAPIYVKGNYNLNYGTDASVGQTNTANTKPAALIGDAVTMLSANWNDGNTTGTGLSSRVPVNTTVNAAILAGIVESQQAGGVGHYSGGVENFPRFLENWSNKSLTYNGSMVVMFPSRYATNFWQKTGIYYNPPARKWAFDMSFLNSDKLPPLTPQVRKLVRGQWRVIASN